MKKLFCSFLTLCAVLFVVSSVSAASPDGSGPWADGVVSSSQGNTKGGQPVSVVNPLRSDPQAAVGVAEDNTVDGSFFSLGFGGSITLSFDNGVRNGIIVVEATNPEYPQEQARIEVSADNVNWTIAGVIIQDAQLSMPENMQCVKYVRITDMSNLENFTDDTADGFDVDGVSTQNAQACDPVVTPTPNDTITPTPVPNNNGGGSNNNSNNQPSSCTASKPGTPTITSVTRTSGSTVQLTWSAVADATTYAISYGTQSGNYQYGVPSTGNTTTYSIGGLDPNATYYFVVRAIRDCMPGDSSGQSSTGGQQVLGASTGDVLGASTDVLAATGNGVQKTIALSVSLLSGLMAFGLYRFTKSI